jgi:hypothetical protein
VVSFSTNIAVMGLFQSKKSDKTTEEMAIGPELLAVLPKEAKPWYLTKHLILLNIILLVPLFSSATVGYDGEFVCNPSYLYAS